MSSSDYTITTLKNAAERIEIKGRFYRLTTYLWRDFMPKSSREGKSLIAIVKVIPFDSFKFPKTLDADRIWVINDEEVWKSDLTGRKLPQSGTYLEKKALNGPKWDPKITVDVVVRLVSPSQNKYLLKASNQIIHQTH